MVSCTLFGVFKDVREKSNKLLNEPKLVQTPTEFNHDEDNFPLRCNLLSEWFDLEQMQGLYQ